MNRIAIASDNRSLIESLRLVAGRLDAEVVDATSSEGVSHTAASTLLAQRPSTVLLGPGLELEDKVRLTEQIDSVAPEVVVTWIAEASTDTWRAASQAGARDLIPPSATDTEWMEHLTRVMGIGDRRLATIDGLDPAESIETRGRVIVVVSPKGGSGKTMLSTSLAIGINALSPSDVVLVDLDLQFGDVSTALGQKPEYTIFDLVRSTGDATAMKAFLTPHPAGIYTLAAPTNPVDAEEIEASEISKTLNSLSMEFGWVIVDTSAGVDDATLTALDEATDVVFVTTIDVASIQALRKLVVVLDRLRLDNHRRWFMLNRATSRTGLSKAEIQEVTGLGIDVEIPSTRAVSESMNRGTPVIVDRPRHKVGKALAEAAQLLTEDGRKRKGLFR